MVPGGWLSRLSAETFFCMSLGLDDSTHGDGTITKTLEIN